MSNITNDTGISLKMVVSIVAFAVFLTTTYLNLHNQQEKILTKIETIERSLANDSWTRSNMDRFAFELRLNNPDIKVPSPSEVAGAGS